jgi:hypothetical protein
LNWDDKKRGVSRVEDSRRRLTGNGTYNSLDMEEEESEDVMTRAVKPEEVHERVLQESQKRSAIRSFVDGRDREERTTDAAKLPFNHLLL